MREIDVFQLMLKGETFNNCIPRWDFVEKGDSPCIYPQVRHYARLQVGDQFLNPTGVRLEFYSNTRHPELESFRIAQEVIPGFWYALNWEVICTIIANGWGDKFDLKLIQLI